MKKALIMLIALAILVSCAPMNDDPFTPPRWILGTWSHEGEDMFEFVKDDVIDITGSIRQSKKTMYKPEWLFDIKKTAKEYRYTIRIEDTEQTVRFVKISKNTLEYTLSEPEGEIGTLILTRE